jgi:hypothetical protein
MRRMHFKMIQFGILFCLVAAVATFATIQLMYRF